MEFAFDVPFTQKMMSDAPGLRVPHLNPVLSKLQIEGRVGLNARRVEFIDLKAVSAARSVPKSVRRREPSRRIPGLDWRISGLVSKLRSRSRTLQAIRVSSLAGAIARIFLRRSRLLASIRGISHCASGAHYSPPCSTIRKAIPNAVMPNAAAAIGKRISVAACKPLSRSWYASKSEAAQS